MCWYPQYSVHTQHTRHNTVVSQVSAYGCLNIRHDFGPQGGLTGIYMYICIVSATLTPWNEVHGHLPGSDIVHVYICLTIQCKKYDFIKHLHVTMVHMYTCMHMYRALYNVHVHENSVGLSSTTNPNLRRNHPTACSGKPNFVHVHAYVGLTLSVMAVV